MHERIYANVNVRMSACMHVCIYVCMHVCKYVRMQVFYDILCVRMHADVYIFVLLYKKCICTNIKKKHVRITMSRNVYARIWR